MNQTVFQQESLPVSQQEKEIDWAIQTAHLEETLAIEDWWHKRQLDGSLNRVPKDFYPQVWNLLKHCKGLVVGDKLERRNRLESELLLAEMTPGEKNFALQVEHLLNKIQAPEYRQVNIEALMELAAFMERNPHLRIQEYIVLDVLIGHAVRLAWLAKNPTHGDRYDEHKAAAWRNFYSSSPYDCATYVVNALRFLIQMAQTSKQKTPIFDPESANLEASSISVD